MFSLPPAREILVVTPCLVAPRLGPCAVAERLVETLKNKERFRFTMSARSCLGNLKSLRQKVAAADIVWLHNTLDPATLWAFLLARRRGKRIVITQHTGPIPHRNPLRRVMARWLDRLVTAPMLRTATQTVFVSDRIGEGYYSWVGFTTAVKIVPNGVDPHLFHAPMTEKRRYLRQQFALRADQPVLLFVGNFNERKGVNVLRQLATLLPGWRFWLAGEGPIDPTLWLKPNVHVFAGRSGESLAELYHAADLLVAPGYGEGFPLVIQEALACGLPVLCSPETAEGSQQAKHLLHCAEVWPGDPQRTADAWARALKNLPLRLPLGGPQLELADFAEMTWTPPPLAEVYAEIFDHLA